MILTDGLVPDGYGLGTWTQTSVPNANWNGIASDSTGRYLAAVVDDGWIYVNNNYGSGTWTQTSAPSAGWSAIASDSTGRYLAAVVYVGGIYVNSNYGSGTWTQTSAPSANWISIASDSTGRYLAAGKEGRIYTSKYYFCDISCGRKFLTFSYF